ncbi:MAG: glycosyltransferase family 39 protein [Elusimicrobiales bacterium]
MKRAAIIILALLAAGLAAQCFFPPGLMADEGMWTYIAKVWLKTGVPPYAGGVENKTPGIFYVFAAANTLGENNYLFPRFLAAAMLCGAGILLKRLADMLAGEAAGIWTLAAYCALLLLDKTEAFNLAATESFMICFSILAFYIYARGIEGAKPAAAFWAGAAMGTAVLFKQVALASMAALMAWPFLHKGKTMREKLAQAGIIAGGALAVNIAAEIPLLACGGYWRQYFDCAWLSLFKLLRVPGAATASAGGHWRMFVERWSGWWWFAPPLAVFAALLGRIRYGCAAGIWLLADFCGANLSGDYYTHQFKQVIPSLALACGLAASAVPARAVYASLLALAVAASSGLKLYARWDSRARHDGEFAGLEAGRLTAPGNYVYVCEHRASPAQAYSGRLSPSRYFNTIFVFGESEKKEVLASLEARPPALMLVQGGPPEWIENYISARGYGRIFSSHGYGFYARRA